MSDEFIFNEVGSGDNPIVDVVFIHGLMGSSRKTWVASGGKEFWPEMLLSELSNISVYTLDYPASALKRMMDREMDMLDRAASSAEYMVAMGIGKRPIVFITHSLGGVLVKMIIKESADSCDSNMRQISDNVRLVAFLSTPHLGNSFASILKSFSGGLSSEHINLISGETGVLDEVGLHYRNFANSRDSLKTVAYCETLNTKSILLVSKDSADPRVNGTKVILVDKNHIDICKPKSKDDPVFVGLQYHIKNVLNSCNEFDDDPYGEKHDSDRRNLIEKLIAVNREYEYSVANDYQNRFSRRYFRKGMYLQEQQEKNALLHEVKYRFDTEIYLPMICKGDSDENVHASINSKVVAPISEMYRGSSGVDKNTVLGALYFLAQQCHIRWDDK